MFEELDGLASTIDSLSARKATIVDSWGEKRI